MKWLLAAALIWLAWRVLAKPAPKKSEVAKARALLGVRADADAGEIRAAHRRLMADAHPDRGGSDAAARRLNAARDALLARIEERG
jgi:DnaJ-domain-containing protein 1